MATTMEEVCMFLEERELTFQLSDDESIAFTAFTTENYVNKDGEKLLGIMISLEEDGEFIKVFAPRCYNLTEEKHKKVTFQTLLMISWVTKMVQYEYDHSDGEIRAIIEFPLEDATLTSRQLMRAIMAIVEVCERNHDLIKNAITEGKINLDAFSQENQLIGLLQGLVGNIEDFQEGLEEAGIDVGDLEQALGELQGLVTADDEETTPADESIDALSENTQPPEEIPASGESNSDEPAPPNPDDEWL